MELLNTNARKSIKIMVKVAQTARFVSLMPNPKDFGTRLTGDIVYLSARIQEMANSINKVLDGYGDIPVNYFNTQLNSIMESANNTLNRVETYAQYNIDNINGIKEDVTNTVDNIIKVQTDISKGFTKSSSVVTNASTKVKADKSVTESLSYIGNVNGNINDGLKDLSAAQAKTTGFISDKTNVIKSEMNEKFAFVQNIIKELKSTMDNLSTSVDKNFGVTNKTAISSTLKNITVEGLTSDKYDDATILAGRAVSALSGSASSIIENFSLGRCISAFTGVAASAAAVKIGLDKLPPINIDLMLNNIRGIENGVSKSRITIDDLVDYDDTKFKKYKEQFNEELKNQRDKIKLELSKKKSKSKLISSNLAEIKANRNATKEFGKSLSDEDKKEIKSAIKEIKKQKKKARNAKQSQKYKDILKSEMKRLKEDCNKFMKQIKHEWNTMLNTYKKAIKEIKTFFTAGGPGDQAVEEICLDINENADAIVRLVTKELPVQIANCSLNVALPRAVGWCFPNIGQHIVQFIMECKVIIKFIMDIIKYVTKIIKDIRDLVNMIMNGINSFMEIYKQLTKLCRLDWLLGLISWIKDKFSQSIVDNIELMENSLVPVYYGDTEEFEYVSEIIDNIDGEETDDDGKVIKSSNSDISKAANILHNIDGFDWAGAFKLLQSNSDDDKIDQMYDKLDEIENIIVAYKSPYFKRENGIPVPDKLEYWDYYHPNLYHFDTSEFNYTREKKRKRKQRRKSKFIKKAAKKSAKKNGGVKMIEKKKKLYKSKSSSTKYKTAYSAFYWYRVYTDDIDDTEYRGTDDLSLNNNSVIVKVSASSENGSMVEVTDESGNKLKVFVKDAKLQSGDYVNVEGKRYKIS